jgi:hypothetical protein
MIFIIFSCGDGSLGEPPARGDGYQCGNMKLLLKQQQRVRLSISTVLFVPLYHCTVLILTALIVYHGPDFVRKI